MSKSRIPTNKYRETRTPAEAKAGKSANDTNKTGDQAPTQKNEGRRTPESRHDREGNVGSTNQHQARKGAGGVGH